MLLAACGQAESVTEWRRRDKGWRSADRRHPAAAARSRTRFASFALFARYALHRDTRVPGAHPDAQRRASLAWPAAEFFEGRLCGSIALGMRRPRLLARHVQPFEQARHAPQAVAYAIAALDTLAELDEAPGADAITLRISSARDMDFESGLLAFAQALGRRLRGRS